MTQTKEPQPARLKIELDPRLRSRLEHAAALRGMSLEEFVVWSAKQAATRALQEHEATTLAERARSARARQALNPSRSSSKAVLAARRFNKVPR